MPWHIENDNPGCQGFAVVKDADGDIVGCHRTRDQALAQLAALSIAEPEERAPGYEPTDAMIAEAERGLKWRDEYNRGGTEIGVARARDIVNRRALSLDTVNRMVSYFARHEVDKEGQGWSPDQDGYPSAGRIAWALWGGDPGRTWAESIANRERAGTGPAAIIVDIDGTLTIDGNVNNPLIEYLNSREAVKIVVTGREERQRESTSRFLDRIGLDYRGLRMNPGGDSNAHKRDTAVELMRNHDVILAVENNPDARAIYEELGIDTMNPMARRELAEEILATLRARY